MKNARLLHYSHCVSDIERSKRFYTDVLGFEVVVEFDFDDEATAQVMGLPGAKFRGIFMKCDGMRIELIGFSEPRPSQAPRPRAANEIGHSHLSFYVDDLDAALKRLRAHNVEVCGETRAELPGGVECCVVRDPDGFPIEIVQLPGGELGLAPYE